MHKVANHNFASNTELIKIANVPGLMLENVKVVEDSSLHDEIVIEVEERMKPLGFSFTFTQAGSMFVAYLNRSLNDSEDPGILSAASFKCLVLIN